MKIKVPTYPNSPFPFLKATIIKMTLGSTRMF